MKIESIREIPTTESDVFEFKSGKTSSTEMRKKLSAAASGFGNSGGGIFVMGIDNEGNVDGGWPNNIGRQSITDWIDQIVNTVEPAPNYNATLIDDVDNRGKMDPGKSLVVVEFSSTPAAPHMAPDNKYYIRAGAHTVPARNYIVEALFAKRSVSYPRLTHLVKGKPGQPGVIQLGVVAVTSEPCIDVSISVTGLKDEVVLEHDLFPLEIPLIDRENPFFFDITTWDSIKDEVTDNARVKLTYHDQTGRQFDHDREINIIRAIGPFQINIRKSDHLIEAVKSIARVIKDK